MQKPLNCRKDTPSYPMKVYHRLCCLQSSELKISMLPGSIFKVNPQGEVKDEARGSRWRWLPCSHSHSPSGSCSSLWSVEGHPEWDKELGPLYSSIDQSVEMGFSLQTCGLELSLSLQPSTVPWWGKGSLAVNCQLSTP